jgi:tetratricopeptide (TPR) repeat protein
MLRRSDANALLAPVAVLANTSNDATELARAGRALHALGRVQAANAAYREAASRRPSDPAINTAWGELFLEKYNKTEALKSFQAALKSDPKWAPALVGVAGALLDDNPPQAVSQANRALEVNPSSVDALVLLAAKAADDDHHDAARRFLQKALTVNPSSLEAHALLAALFYIEDKQTEFDAQVAKTLAIAPKYAEVYITAGQLAGRHYRFDEAAVLTRRGLELDPTHTRGLADLGSHLFRTGDEAGARAALEASFKSDPYDVATYNMLALLDTLDKFETIRDGNLILRLSKDEAPVLKEYALSLAHRALSTFSERYDFKLPEPTLIEIFSRHDDFAVRTIALPGMVGALGACFGRVVAMDSSAGRLPVGGHALARARARRHPAGVQAARAAMADRRHLGFRREARAPGVGEAHGRAVRPVAQSRPDAEAARSQRGVHGSDEDLARVFPGGACR